MIMNQQTTLKKYWLILLLVLVTVCVKAQVTVDGITYNLNGNEAEVTTSSIGEYTGEIVIPSSITYEGAEYSVTSIGDFAFWGSGSLTSVTMPGSLVKIGEYAFFVCSSLVSVAIPDNVSSIGKDAFGSCSNLTNIEVGQANEDYSSSDGVLFNKKQDLLIICPPRKSGQYVIPENVSSIGYAAFSGCSRITGITIPESVASIEDFAFYGCSGITSIAIPDNVTSIKESTFQGCSSLENVIIPSRVTSIGNSAFDGCTSLISITIPSGVTSIGETTFSNCESLVSIEVEQENSAYSSVDGVLFNKEKDELVAFPGGRKGHYSIPNSVTSVFISAFSSCRGLTSVTIPSSVTNIGDFAFYYCDSISDIYCYGSESPTLESEYGFSDAVYSEATLHVQSGSTSLYKTATGWSNFVNIVEDIDTSIEDVDSEGLDVHADNGRLVINGAKGLVYVCSYNGILIHKTNANGRSIIINVPSNDTYIVKVGNKTVKVQM